MVNLIRTAFFLLFVFSILSSTAQNTIGTVEIAEGVQDGYTLFAPSASTKTYLVDNCGNLVNEWVAQATPGLSAYLTPEGNLVRTRREPNNTFFAGGQGGGIEIFNWFGAPIWEFVLSDDDNLLHHDISVMPNGNILAIAYERITQAEALNAGRDLQFASQNGLWTDVIIEIKPLPNFEHEIVWKWRAIDHVVQNVNPSIQNFGNLQDFPERLDINFVTNNASSSAILDWMHCNAIDYNEKLDQIILNSRNYSEFYIIDHSTTTEEASTSEGGRYGKGGDLLYRWGNPAAYNSGTVNDQQLYSQHDANWIDEGLPDEGKVFVFNNGVNRPGGLKSSVDVIDLPMEEDGSYILDGSRYGPEEAEWVYGLGADEEDITGARISGVGRQPNGNTLITVGPTGTFIEIDEDKNVVWKYIIPLAGTEPNTQGNPLAVNTVFRSYKYPLDYPAFLDNFVNIGDPIELEPNNEFCMILPAEEPAILVDPVQLMTNLVETELKVNSTHELSIAIVDISGQVQGEFELQIGQQTLPLYDLPAGVYFLRNINSDSSIFVKQKFIKIH